MTDLEVCSKCGAVDDPAMEYRHVTLNTPSLLNRVIGIPLGEHLVVWCRRCGYERLEPVENAAQEGE